VRSSIIDTQRTRMTTNIDSERPPRKWLLENPLAKIASKEKSIGYIGSKRRMELQLRHIDILSLINDNIFKWPVLSLSYLRSQSAKHFRMRHPALLLEPGTHRFKDIP